MSLPSYDEALIRLLDGVPPLGSEVVELRAARGRVLAEDILADRDQPPFNRAAMDGFALRSSEYESGKAFTVVGLGPAGAPPSDFDARPGEIIRIATGAAVPETFDAVVQHELSAVVETRPRELVRLSADSVNPWRSIHRKGADASRGQVLLRSGARLTPQAIGLAAAVGQVKLCVARRPRVVLLTTGDEVLPPDTPGERMAPHQIRNSNGPMLGALLEACGAELLRHEHLPDELPPTRDAAQRALGDAHVVLTVGGVSAGQRDLLPSVWDELGLETILRGVSIQPGKPVFAARERVTQCLVLGLPGNPVSVLATAHLFLWPLVRRMLGQGPPTWRLVPLAEPVQPNPHRELFRAAVLTDTSTARVLSWHGSGDLAHTAAATGWIRLPQQEPALTPPQNVPYLPMLT